MIDLDPAKHKTRDDTTYLDVLVGNTDSNHKDKAIIHNTQKEDSEWTVVHRKHSHPKNGKKPVFSIFIYNIPTDATSKVIWNLFKDCGKVLDIILPRKRDKKNKRFGFVLTTSEEEAGLIIPNAKEKGGVDSRICMTINNQSDTIHKDVKLDHYRLLVTDVKNPKAHNEKFKSRKISNSELNGSLWKKCLSSRRRQWMRK